VKEVLEFDGNLAIMDVTDYERGPQVLEVSYDAPPVSSKIYLAIKVLPIESGEYLRWTEYKNIENTLVNEVISWSALQKISRSVKPDLLINWGQRV